MMVNSHTVPAHPNGSAIIVPPDTLVRDHTTSKQKLYNRHEVSAALFCEVANILGLAPTRLGLVLGAQDNSMAIRWKRGHQRPSPTILERMIFLLMEKLKGNETFRLKQINWETGEVIYYADSPKPRAVARWDATPPKAVYKGEGDG